MKAITLEELLEAGCHFGHQVNRRNPKANEFIFEPRSNVHIINLEKTHEGLVKAAEYLRNLSSKDGYLVIVGTKKQASGIVKEEIERAKKEGANRIYYITSRWVGGLLTNYEEVAKNVKKLKNLREFLSSNKRQDYTKREISLFEREKNKLESLYAGVADLDRVPDALFIIDINLEKTAVHEAKIMHVATVGIADTNSDPSVVEYPIPANDDAVGSIKIITSYLIDAWVEGSQSHKGRDRLQGAAADKGGETPTNEAKTKKEVKKEEAETEAPKSATAKVKANKEEEKTKSKSKIKSQRSKTK